MDDVDRDLVRLLLADARATYQDLGRAVGLSANTTAERVRRLRATGVVTGYHAAVDLDALGRGLVLLGDVRLQDGVDGTEFERRLADVPQVIGAVRVTGQYDYQLRIACTGPGEVEAVTDRLRRQHGVRELHTRLLLHEVPLGPDRLLGPDRPAAGR